LDANSKLDQGRLRSLINSMADGVIATDEHGRVVVYNGAALNILDSNKSIKGKSIGRLMELIDKNNQPVDARQLVVNAKTPDANRDLRLKYADGSTISLYLSIAPVHLGYGHQDEKGYVLLLRDITREKSLEEERDEFISVVSHELRTPIAIAEGNVGNAMFLLEKSGTAAQLKTALQQAHAQILFLSGLINDLATLSRAERGKLDVDVEPINAHDLIEDLAANYKEQATLKKLVIQTDIDPGLELLQSSRLYVREILQNFITNAIKYTEEGQVTIGARPKSMGVEFFVSDSGIGISKADQERVFDKFFRSEDYRTRANSGTGLGLYVTMKLARLLHAEIELESTLNHGSTFSIYIPNLK
jgi:PAS domain S-box-containing protein